MILLLCEELKILVEFVNGNQAKFAGCVCVTLLHSSVWADLCYVIFDVFISDTVYEKKANNKPIYLMILLP